MAQALAGDDSPAEFELTTFPNDEGYDELVLVAGHPAAVVCEHHMLPFSGVAHVGYLPDERILGLSKLARMVELLRPPPADPGAAHHADRRRTSTSELAAARRRRGDRGRAHVHEPPRRPRHRHEHGDLDVAGRLRDDPSHRGGVPAP